jgi:hypothetical protein
MTDEQASDWAYKIICCLGISTSNSDINVVGLHKTVKELYEQGQANEREANAKLLNDFAKTTMIPVVDSFKAGLKAGSYAILSRGNHENAPLP